MAAIRYINNGADRYVEGDIEPFDQKNTMFKRPYWQSSMAHLKAHQLFAQPKLSARIGERLQEHAFNVASRLILRRYAGGGSGRKGLFEWYPKKSPSYLAANSHLIAEIGDPQQNTQELKKIAAFMGAAMTGICKVDRRWLYSPGYDEAVGAISIDIPDRYEWAIVLAIEMDYDAVSFSPGRIASAAASMGYSKMAVTAGMVAEYIRGMGFEAFPCGNDTACSIPMAIDAGLGELARNGLLITPRYGPRVRLAKIFTNLPLLPDQPIEFGVWEFCRICKKCAQKCPSKSIPFGEATDEINNRSNRPGVRRWALNSETCLEWWFKNGSSCSVCIRACPFNKPSGALHDLVRFGISRMPVFNRLYLLGDDLIGYGRKKKAEQFWKSR